MRKNSRSNYSLSIDQEEPPIGRLFLLGEGGEGVVFTRSGYSIGKAFMTKTSRTFSFASATTSALKNQKSLNFHPAFVRIFILIL